MILSLPSRGKAVNKRSLVQVRGLWRSHKVLCGTERLLHFAAALPRPSLTSYCQYRPLTLTCQGQLGLPYSPALGVVAAGNDSTGLIAPGMTGIPSRYDVTITLDREDGHFPNPAEFAVAAEQAALARNTSVTV